MAIWKIPIRYAMYQLVSGRPVSRNTSNFVFTRIPGERILHIIYMHSIVACVRDDTVCASI